LQTEEKFRTLVQSAAKTFLEIPTSENIKVVSHLDADGISACAILLNALRKLNRNYSVSILAQLSNEKIQALSEEDHKVIIFTDLGSGQLEMISKTLKDKKIIILDHHQPSNNNISSNIVHVNPHLVDIDGTKNVSGAGVVYFFTNELTDNKEMSGIAMIGAIGDVQENDGFVGLNDIILKDAVEKGIVQVKKEIRFYGSRTRPLYRLLQYADDPHIPGVSGSESGAIQFLRDVGIEPKNGKDWIKISDLSSDDRKKLTAAIIVRRGEKTDAEDIFGNTYVLANERKGSPFRDAKEFSTLLNSCGRMDKASLGINVCLGDKQAKSKALEHLTKYKRGIVEALKWYKSNRDSLDIFDTPNLMIVDAETNVSAKMIGTIASMISKGSDIEPGKYVMTLAKNEDNMYKVSLRISGTDNNTDLRDIVKQIVNKVGGEAGGHKCAAGALIEPEHKDNFIATAKELLVQE